MESSLKLENDVSMIRLTAPFELMSSEESPIRFSIPIVACANGPSTSISHCGLSFSFVQEKMNTVRRSKSAERRFIGVNMRKICGVLEGWEPWFSVLVVDNWVFCFFFGVFLRSKVKGQLLHDFELKDTIVLINFAEWS